MPKLILVKHARPTVTPDQPPERWPLSDEGRAKCAALAERVRPHGPAVVVSSDEVKASETGELVAAALGVPFEVEPGVREHDRSNVPQMRTPEFISYMALLFKKPGERVLGLESAGEALARFSDAIRAVQARHVGKDVAVVTHGTVLALYVADRTDEDPFTLWRRMGLPSFVVMDGARVVEAVDAV
jgi:broad specificity phosphatase PhoE